MATAVDVETPIDGVVLDLNDKPSPSEAIDDEGVTLPDSYKLASDMEGDSESCSQSDTNDTPGRTSRKGWTPRMRSSRSSKSSRTSRNSTNSETYRKPTQRLSALGAEELSRAVGGSEGDEGGLKAGEGEVGKPLPDDEVTRPRLRALSLVIVPPILAILPVAFPFGDPFGGTIAENWAYYFVYNLFGWGMMWMKVTLWNCELWEVPFCFPFMLRGEAYFQFNASVGALLIPTVFSVGLFLFLMQVVFNSQPVPLGTLTGGTLCFGSQFASVYFLIIPKEKRQTLADHIRIARCLMPILLFILQLTLYIMLTWVLVAATPNLAAVPKALSRLGLLLAMVMIRETLVRIPPKQLMGAVSLHMAVLWTCAFRGTYAAFTAFLFPAMTDSFATALCFTLVNQFIALYNFLVIVPSAPTACRKLIGVALTAAADVSLSFGFLCMFLYNAYGPNAHLMYVIRDLNNDDKVFGACWIACVGLLHLFRVNVILRLSRERFSAMQLESVARFIRTALRDWYWLVLWLFVSTTLACGACMIMVHDGMDLSMRFEEWVF